MRCTLREGSNCFSATIDHAIQIILLEIGNGFKEIRSGYSLGLALSASVFCFLSSDLARTRSFAVQRSG